MPAAGKPDVEAAGVTAMLVAGVEYSASETDSAGVVEADAASERTMGSLRGRPRPLLTTGSAGGFGRDCREDLPETTTLSRTASVAAGSPPKRAPVDLLVARGGIVSGGARMRLWGWQIVRKLAVNVARVRRE